MKIEIKNLDLQLNELNQKHAILIGLLEGYFEGVKKPNEDMVVLINSRISDLEVKMAKLWTLLIETSNATGKEKTSKMGRKFSGLLK